MNLVHFHTTFLFKVIYHVIKFSIYCIGKLTLDRIKRLLHVGEMSLIYNKDMHIKQVTNEN